MSTNHATFDAALRAQLAHTLQQGLEALELAPAHAAPLLDYLDLLLRWNRTYNLTAIRDPQAMVTLHLLDSLAMHAQLDGIRTLADLGTGAGLPGIPLAIVRPQLRVTLVESNGKKARFMREALRRLQLGNAEVAESRIEALDRPGAFDAITARALATLPLILELGGHLLAPEGVLLAMKGVYPADELAALPSGWALQQAWPLQVPGLEAERHLLRIGRAPAAGAGAEARSGPAHPPVPSAA